MTEESFQQARKVMQSANCLRGYITKAKGEVAKWTKIEDVHRQELRQSQADGAKKCLDKAIKRLQELRAKFAAMTFPDPNLTIEVNRCTECGCKIAAGNTLCGECACEDDSDY